MAHLKNIIQVFLGAPMGHFDCHERTLCMHPHRWVRCITANSWVQTGDQFLFLPLQKLFDSFCKEEFIFVSGVGAMLRSRNRLDGRLFIPKLVFLGLNSTVDKELGALASAWLMEVW